MRIVIFSRGFPTPAEPMQGVFEYDQAKALAAAGNQVILAVLDLRSLRRSISVGRRSFKEDNLHVEILRYPLGRVPSGLKQQALKHGAQVLYGDILKKYGCPDVLHSHFLQIGNGVVQGLGKMGVPIIHTEHSSLLNKDVIQPELKQLGLNTYPLCDQVLTVSSTFARILQKHFGIAVKVVPNIVNTALFHPTAEKKTEMPFRIISVASLNPNKRMDLLIRAYARAFQNEKDHELLIIGRGSEEQKLQSLVHQLGMTAHVHFLGQCTRTQIARAMEQSHCFCLLSETETFGVAFAEALAAGLPVIATCCGGAEDFVDNQTGLLIQDETEEAISMAMLKMRDVWDTFDPLTLAAGIEKRMAPAVVAQALMAVYESLQARQ